MAAVLPWRPSPCACLLSPLAFAAPARPPSHRRADRHRRPPSPMRLPIGAARRCFKGSCRRQASRVGDTRFRHARAHTKHMHTHVRAAVCCASPEIATSHPPYRLRPFCRLVSAYQLEAAPLELSSNWWSALGCSERPVCPPRRSFLVASHILVAGTTGTPQRRTRPTTPSPRSSHLLPPRPAPSPPLLQRTCSRRSHRYGHMGCPCVSGGCWSPDSPGRTLAAARRHI